MATKDGLEKLLELVEEAKSKPGNVASNNIPDGTTMKMLQEILKLVKEDSASKALVRSSSEPNDNTGSPQRGADTRRIQARSLDMDRTNTSNLKLSHGSDGRLASLPENGASQEMLSIMRKVTQSVHEGGGMTNEVKALVRELRGEVLGMGRNLVRQLEEVGATRSTADNHPSHPDGEEISAIVNGALHDLREQLASIVDDNKHHHSTLSELRTALGGADIYSMVKRALDEFEMPQTQLSESRDPGLQREEILDTVKQAWETYKPEIELQNFGLERDEILECLAEGLRSYQPQHEQAATYDQVLAAVEAGMQSFGQPHSFTKEDIVETIRECLGEHHFNATRSMHEEHLSPFRDEILRAVTESVTSQNALTHDSLSSGLGREEILSAVSNGVEAHFAAAKGMEQSHITKDDVTNVVNSALAAHNYANDTGVGSTLGREEILGAIAEGLENQNNSTREIELNKDDLMETIASGLQEAASSANFNVGEQVLERLQDLLEGMKEEFKQYSAANGKDTEQVLDAIRDGLDVVRKEIESNTVCASDVSGKDEIMGTVKEGLRLLQADMERTIVENAMSNASGSQPQTPELLDAMEKEFEHLRQTLSSLLVRDNASADKDEILEAIREVGDHLRDESIHSKGSEGSTLSATSELLDAFNDGLGSIRDDLAKLLDKQADVDSAVTLDAIKESLSGLKADMEMLREPHKDSDGLGSARRGDIMLADDPGTGGGVDSLKALIATLEAKVDAMETDGASAKKYDTDAIENLLHAMRSRLDELAFPAADEMARAEHFTALEGIMNETKGAVAELSARFEADGSTKSEVNTLETLLKETWLAVDELKNKGIAGDGDGDGGRLGKSDLQTLEAMIFEVRTQVEDLRLPDVDTLPTKKEFEDLSATVTEFREKVEADNEMTGQAFDARKAEHGGLADKIEEAKAIVGNLGTELKSKLDGSSEGLDGLKQLLEGLVVSMESFATVENVKELTELINHEFERAREEQDASNLEREERHEAATGQHDENRAAMVAEIGEKIDDKLGDLLAKYDEAQTTMAWKFSETEKRDTSNLEATTDTKNIAEDLKLIISDMSSNLNEACERINVDTKTFFEKVNESYDKMEQVQSDFKSHHETARSDMEKTVAASDRVESKMHEFHPQILDAVTEILSIVGQHYDHSQKTAEEFQKDLSALPATLPSLLPTLPSSEQSKYDDSQVHQKLDDLLGHAKSNPLQDGVNTLLERVTNDQVHGKLDQLLARSPDTNAQVYEKLDQLLNHATGTSGPVHDKLDTLLDRTTNVEQSVTQMMKLDEMHKDIMETSRRMNEMTAGQSPRVSEGSDQQRREMEDATVALERKNVQREQVELELSKLSDEKNAMLKDIQSLKSEKDGMVAQNTKLGKELSGLEMALELRHEEMRVMEERAGSLEKRILEGVLDHARTVLINRPNSQQSMNLKRSSTSRSRKVSGATTASTTSTSTTKDPRSILGSGVGMAVNRRPQGASGANAPSHGTNERRILSLSHVTSNRGACPRQTSGSSGLTDLKRSHSVKSNFAQRKASWGGRNSIANKENESFLEEDEQQSGDESDAATERRTSYTGTVTDSMLYGTGSTVSSNRRTSTGSSTKGLVAGTNSLAGESVNGDDQQDGGADDEYHEAEDQTPNQDVPAMGYQGDGVEDDGDRKMVLYGQSDSGLGTEVTSQG